MSIHRACLLIGLFVLGCSKSPQMATPTEPTAVPASRPPFSLLPVTLTVMQRSTTSIPESNEQYTLTIDDITRGQVLVSLQGGAGPAHFGPVSMAAGDSRRFEVDGGEYLLTLASLDNQLVGNDAAVFVLNAAPPAAAAVLTEAEKIERLIAAVAALDGAVFLRNGGEHTPAEAADHLQQKREAAGDRVTTAREFIEQVASKSSFTGEDYTLRLPDDRTQSAREFLMAELSKLEPARP